MVPCVDKNIIFRDIDLMTETSPESARFAPNGRRYTALLFEDFLSSSTDLAGSVLLILAKTDDKSSGKGH